MEELKSFLSFSTAKILHIITDEKILTSIKVDQTLKSTNFSGKNGSLIFNKLPSLLRMEYVNDAKHVSKAFDCKANLLIIVNKEVRNGLENFCDIICNILRKPNKKIVVISNKKSEIMLTLKKLNNSVTVISHTVKFNEMTDESQKMVRKQTVINFQGNELYLENFVSKEESSELIDPKTLQEMILGETIKIGNPIETFSKTETNYYRPRQIRLIRIHDNLFEDKELPENHLFVFEGSNVEEFLKRKNVDDRIISINDLVSKGADDHKVFILMEESQSETQFDQICEKFPGRCIHWLKYGSNKLYWFYSHAPERFMMSKLKSYISHENEYVSELFFGKLIERNKIVIIADTAGMGKSTILTSFSNTFRKREEQWMIRINLNKYTPELLKIQKFPERKDQKLYLNFENFNDETDDYAKLILESLIATEPNDNTILTFENRIFDYFFTKRGMLILLDGFDEINPDYGDAVLNLIHILRKTGNHRIWITSRRNFKEKLENEFNTFAYDLKPFHRNDQEQFLKQFWTSTYKMDKGADMPNQDRLPNFIKILLDEATCKIGDIIGIPLQTKMLAEVFRESHDKKNEGKNDNSKMKTKMSDEVVRESQDGINEENKDANQNKWISCYEYVESKVEIPLEKLNISVKLENIFMLYENFFKEKVFKYFLQEKGIVEPSKPFTRRIENDLYNAEYFVHKIFGYLAFNENSTNLLTENEKHIKNEWLKGFRDGIENIGIIDDFNGEERPIFTHFTYGEYLAACFLVDKLCVSPYYCQQVFRMANDIFSKEIPIFVECFKHKLKQEIDNGQLKEGLKGKSVLQFVIEHGFLNCINVFMQSNDFNHKFPNSDEFDKTVLHYAVECSNLDGVIYLIFWIYKLFNDVDLFLNYLSSTFFKENGTLTLKSNLQCFLNDLKTAEKQHVKYKTEVNIKRNICELQNKNDTRVSDALEFEKNDEMKVEFLNLLSTQSIESIFNCIFFENVDINMIIRFTNNLSSRSDMRVEEKVQILERIIERYGEVDFVEKSTKDEIIELIIKNDCEKILHHILTIDDFEVGRLHDSFKIACQSDALQVIKKLLPLLINNPISNFGNFDIVPPYLIFRLDDCAVREKTRLETIIYIYENIDGLNNINGKNWEIGRTSLHTAVKHECNIKTIEYLVEKGFDPNEKDKKEESPWTIAVQNAYDDAIKYFLSKFDNLECDYMVEILKKYIDNPANFDFNQKFRGEPLLQYAITKENFALCAFLIQKGADVNQKGSNKKTLLDYALAEKLSSLFADDDNDHDYNDINFPNFIRSENLMKKLTVNLKDENGNTKLHFAAKNGDTKEIIKLLEDGACYNIKNENGETPKDIAKPENKTLFIEIDQLFIDVRNHNFDFVTKYEKFSFVYSTKDENGKLLFHYAVMKDNVEAVKSMITSENANELDSEAKTAIHYAVMNNNKVMLKTLLNHSYIDFLPLFNNQAFKEIEENDCKTLISNIRKCTDFAFNENIDELNNELGLFENNKDLNFVINVEPQGRKNIVYYALKYPDIALDLLQKGIIVQQLKMPGYYVIKNKIEKILLILTDIAKYVLSKKFEPNSIIKYFNNKFMEALSDCTKDKSVADKIISNARFDFENIHGATLLHIAAIADEAEIAQWLINEKHADPFANDHNDNDVYTLAEKNNSQKVLSLLPPQIK